MAEQKKKIEEIIVDSVDGELQKNALEFIACVRENKLFITTKNYANGEYVIKYKGKGVCNVWIGKGYFNAIPFADFTDEFEKYMKNLNLLEMLWKNQKKCPPCNPRVCAPQAGKSEEEFDGFDNTVLGKKFTDTCKFVRTWFRNPGAEEFECLKAMMEYKVQSIMIGT